jgi:outer membrane protein OmpA-like peptidoglycan-associated protein
MSPNKSIAFALCLAATGCAQTPQDSSAQGGYSWWPFGRDAVASKAADKEVEQAITEKVAKADSKSDSESRWWWPFDTSRAPAQAKAAEVPKVDPKVTKAWLDAYEPKLREAIKDSKFELERREDLLVITAPVDSSFNPDRPSMLLPVSLGPITRVAKAIDADHKTAVLVLGHADTSGAAPLNQKLSQERAQSIASIFRLSGLQRDRLMLRGMGSVMPRAANDSVEGRSLNRRVEILLTPQNTMLALLAKYNQPTFTAAEMLATQDIKAVPTPVAKTPAKAAPKKAAAKPAVAAKKKAAPAAKKADAKKADAKKAVAKKAASNDQAKAH